MGKYLEDRELDSVLENYFEEESKLDKIKAAAKDLSLSDSKNVYIINTRIKEMIQKHKSDYKYFYITIEDHKTEYMGGGNGFYADTKAVTSTVRLYGSNDKLTANDFAKTGEVKYQHKDTCKRLYRKSTIRTPIDKNDIDSELRKYIILHIKKAK